MAEKLQTCFWGRVGTETGYCVAAKLFGNNHNSLRNAYIWLSPALPDVLRKVSGYETLVLHGTLRKDYRKWFIETFHGSSARSLHVTLIGESLELTYFRIVHSLGYFAYSNVINM